MMNKSGQGSIADTLTRDCTGKTAIYLIKKTKPNEKESFFSFVLRSVCTNFSNGKLGGTSAIQPLEYL